MKVLLINGSPEVKGCTYTALSEVAKALNKENIETEIIQIGNKDIRGCLGCNHCDDGNGCVFNDIVNETALKLKEADGLVIGSPVYYASANGTLISFLDRLFYSCHLDLRFKVGAAIASCRRAGSTATLDELNKYFTIAGMPVASSHYWNMVHGTCAQEVLQDEEGMHVMKTLGENMAFLMKSIALGKEKYGIPAKEAHAYTNFIR